MAHFFKNLILRAARIRQSIKTVIIASILLMVLAPMALSCIFFYSTLSQNLKTEADGNLKNFVKQVNGEIASKFDVIDSTAKMILANRAINRILESADPAEEDLFNRSQAISMVDDQLTPMLLFNYAWDSKLIKSIFVFRNEKTYYSVLRDTARRKAVADNLTVYEKMAPIKPVRMILPPTTDNATVYFVRSCNDLNTLKYKGILIIAIDPRALSQLHADVRVYRTARVFTFNSDGIIISASDSSQVGKKIAPEIFQSRSAQGIIPLTLDGRRCFLATQILQDYGLTTALTVEKSEVYQELYSRVQTYSLGILMLAATALIFALVFYAYLSRPLQGLLDSIADVRDGNFTSRMPEYRYDELNRISHHFNTMTDEIGTLINQVYDKQLLMKESELKFLQSQINPHFIRNVLETISWHARIAENDTIYGLTDSLSKLMQANVTFNGMETVTLREELSYVEYYLNLQRSRFGHRLDISVSLADDRLLDCRIPKLSIQPLVENAIIHGLEPKLGHGSLKIQIWEEEAELCCCILDDGVGFDTACLNWGAVDPIVFRREGHTSIGLYNVHRRIHLLYGDAYALKIESTLGEGTRAMMNLPADREDTPCIES